MAGARTPDMAADSSDAPQRVQLALKLAVLALMIAVIGLPINHLFTYSLLVISVIVLAVARVTARRRAWAIAIFIVVAAFAGNAAVDVPQIEEGHNVFLPCGVRRQSTVLAGHRPVGECRWRFCSPAPGRIRMPDAGARRCGQTHFRC